MRMKQDRVFQAKESFNRFFQKELYGRLRRKDNIILSRGGWSDDSVVFPKLFGFCLAYTLKKRWVGYSHSLGHATALEALIHLTNLAKPKKPYAEENIALTIGNSFTASVLFKQLREEFRGAAVVTFCPYYPPIVKSIRSHFEDIRFISSLETEPTTLRALRAHLADRSVKIVFLSNQIGVEGRVFSSDFWKEVVLLTKRAGAMLVIDEGLASTPLPYPDTINQEHVIRMVSLSKKYGVPGMKLGFLLAGKAFMRRFYDYASTNYGGPLSVFFLLSEFLYRFEQALHSPKARTTALSVLCIRYRLSKAAVLSLYNDFVRTLSKNERRLARNRSLLKAWLAHNRLFVEHVHQFGGINVLVQPRIPGKCHSFFLKALRHERVSVMPSVCLGDEGDRMFRITLLEPTERFKEGLSRLSRSLRLFGTPVRAVLLDLDGTLVNPLSPKEGRPEYLLRKLHKKGIQASFATGRGLYYVKHILQGEPTLLDSFFILYDGTLVMNPRTGERLISEPIPQRQAVMVEQKLLRVTSDVYMNKLDGIYSLSNVLPKSSSLAPFWRKTRDHEGVFQIYVRDLDQRQAARIRRILDRNGLAFYSFGNPRGKVSIIAHNKKSDKGRAARTLLKKWRIQAKEAVVVGDGINDAPLFSFGARGVAAPGALPALRRKASIALGENETVTELLEGLY